MERVSTEKLDSVIHFHTLYRDANIHLCHMGATSLSRCCQAVICVADNTLEQGCGQQQNSVYFNSTLWSILKVHHVNRHTEGVSGVAADMGTVW